MIVLLWTIIVGFNGYVFCYENLSRRPTAVLTQSSTFETSIASKANDGKVELDLYTACAHTAPNRSKAWLQVDLGHSYRINNVKIYYRNQDNGWKQYRFRQFYLDVSNSTASETTTSQRTRCYTDNTTAPNLPPNIIDLPCKHTARYVIVETTYDCPEDDPITGAMLEICEIEVYGCKTTCRSNLCDDSGICTNGCTNGYWRPACDFQCPTNCKNCDSKTGQCTSCKSGYWGYTCNSQCPTHCFERVCDKSNGNCKKGCTPGQYGDTCNNTCIPGCVGGTCDQESGNCNSGCKENLTGRICDGCNTTCKGIFCDDSGNCTDGCRNGYWGPACDLQCPENCKNCDSRTGQCTSCKSGYWEDTCNSQCPMHCFERVCVKSNGNCKKGCTPGQYGDTCNNTCSFWCVGGTCDQQSGACKAGCKQNWTGRICDVCDATHYGTTCSLECNINCLNNACNNVNGSCKDGCAFEMFGDFCNETCDEHCLSCCEKNTEKYKKLKDSNSKILLILYGVIAALSISLIVHGYMIIWISRQNKCKGQDVKQEAMSCNSPPQDFVQNQEIYDAVEDNAEYQEMGQLSGSSYYDQLQG